MNNNLAPVLDYEINYKGQCNSDDNVASNNNVEEAKRYTVPVNNPPWKCLLSGFCDSQEMLSPSSESSFCVTY